MAGKVDPQTPGWVLDAVEDALAHGEGALIEAMLNADEDVSNDGLWRHRNSQFLSLLTARATAKNAELSQRITRLDRSAREAARDDCITEGE